MKPNWNPYIPSDTTHYTMADPSGHGANGVRRTGLVDLEQSEGTSLAL